MRSVFVLCCVVIDHFDFPRDIVSSCMNLLDRYLVLHLSSQESSSSSSSCHTTAAVGIPKDAFQLLAMTCLYVAVKLDQPRMLSLQTMAHLSRGTFCKGQMQSMEMEILSRLRWQVHAPTPYTFLSHFMQVLTITPTTTSSSSVGAQATTTTILSPCSVQIYEMARYLVELSVLDYYFVGKRSSSIAVAALLNALEDQYYTNTTAATAAAAHPHVAHKAISDLMVPGEELLVHHCQNRLRGLTQTNAANDPARDAAAAAVPQEEEDPRSWQTSPTSVLQTTSLMT